MRELIKQVKIDKIIKWTIFLSAILLFLHLLFLLLVFMSLPPFIPLFNQMPWGPDRLGTKIEIFLPFFITFSFFLVNFFLAIRFYNKMPLVSRMISITCLLVTFLSLIFLLRMTQLIM